MSFVLPTPDQDRPESPEALFRSLRPRDRAVRDLLLRQGDVLRAYAQISPDETDVAVELPTGGGKTLVGLLIAEWRRRALGHRVAYLCPKVQLARQVANKAHDYGIDVVTLVRSQAAWEGDFTQFQRGNAVAIAGYHQVFNSNPRLDSAQTLVLDDAHAAEDAVASNWSIDARRPSLLHTALVSILAPHLPPGMARRLQQADAGPFDRDAVAVVSPEALVALTSEIEGALAEYATEYDDSNTHAKRMLGSAVGRCMGFVSASAVLIRPLIAPTSEHRAFAGARQRVYMSATLGVAGELERAFGVPRITRITPSAEDEHGFGRRFFVMAHASRERPDPIARQAIAEAGRAVIMTPSDREADEATERLVAEGTPVLTADDVEHDFAAFTQQPSAVLVLSNRYDGVDLPDDACRLVVLSGLPAYAHLQERFLMDALGARRVLSERIRTRIQQGAGRATRNARDFAAVIIRTEPLTDFIARDEEVRAMPAQLQAEIAFGFANSEQPGADLMSLLRSFWAQDAGWQAAEQALRTLTAERRREVSAAERALASSAEKEVLCWRAVFADDLPRAVTLAQEVTDRLIGGDELRSYRALWFYLAASWAFLLARDDADTYLARARELRREADGCASTLRWTPRWVAEPDAAADAEPSTGRAERAAAVLRSLGIRGSRFDAELDRLIELIDRDDASGFEQGVELLGRMLGFESVRPDGRADPDGAWRDERRLWILTEAKTEERADTPLSAETVRQAATHAAWMENVQGWEPPDQTITLVVSHKSAIDAAAMPIAGDLRLCVPPALRAVARRTAEALRQARAGARGMSDEQLADAVARALGAAQLANEELVSELGARRIADG